MIVCQQKYVHRGIEELQSILEGGATYVYLFKSLLERAYRSPDLINIIWIIKEEARFTANGIFI